MYVIWDAEINGKFPDELEIDWNLGYYMYSIPRCS